MPYKRFENWNYCSTHGGDIDNAHHSGTCQKPGWLHNPAATRMNTMGGSTAGLHKTILPSVYGCAPAPSRKQRAPTQTMWQQSPLPINFTSTTMAMCALLAVPYQAIYNVSQQMGHPPPVPAPPPAPPAPQQGTYMMPYYAP
jgi:hypothetical protein